MAIQSLQPVLSLQAIKTVRGEFALQIAQLAVNPGQIVCIVGPNGGGKTTLLLTVLGLLPHTGSCRITGQEYDGTQHAIKQHIGFIPDDPELLFEELTALEYWDIAASMLRQDAQPRQRLQQHAAHLAAGLSFAPPHYTMRQYSHGMRKKAQIVHALLHEPELLIIDELRNGLDPIAITQAEQRMHAERKRGAAILVATHDLWWAERFADYIYILANGAIVAHGTLATLRAPGERHLQQAFMRIIGA
jgi:ABC-2 type transport system ATP-binding protein